MPVRTDFISTPAGAVLSPADVALIRAVRAQSVTLPAPLTVIGHTRLSAFAPIEAQPVAVH